jgi:hypothetical protein
MSVPLYRVDLLVRSMSCQRVISQMPDACRYLAHFDLLLTASQNISLSIAELIRPSDFSARYPLRASALSDTIALSAKRC